MINETGSNRGGRFVACVEPWLLGGAMFAVYLVTIYTLVTPATVGRLAELAGWAWGPKFFAPITFLVTFPISWLPDALKLPALNLFAAICAALTLILLARSVALLPHDRTNEQRVREASENSLLSIPLAWLPPLFAVLVCGLQLSFWERAVEFRDESMLDSGEMFNLLIFAYLIRCLLEFRLSGRQSWLTRFALLYGLGMANNWALVAFFPGFLAAVIWIKGFDFFHWRFVLRMLACGLVGALFILCLPLTNSLHHFSDWTFGSSLHFILYEYKQAILHLLPDRRILIMFGVTSVVPVLLMGITWASSFGDNSPLGVTLANFGFNLVHAFLLLACLWVSLDPPFSPRQMFGFMPFLPLYFLGALSVGYYSGYLLLIFGTQPHNSRQRQSPLGAWVGRLITAGVCLLVIAVPLLQAAKNLPQIQTGRAVARAFDGYFARAAQSLPPSGAVIMADQDDQAMQFFLEARLAQSGWKPDTIFIQTALLAESWDYVQALSARYPQAGILAAFADRDAAKPAEADCVHLLEQLSLSRSIYYLHPSFGYYFERFYSECHGVVYKLYPYSTNSWDPPTPTPELMSENRAFWNAAAADLSFLTNTLRRPPAPTGPVQRLEKWAQLSVETNGFAPILGKYYSRALNYWGVELAKSAPSKDAAVWLDAGASYDLAERLNPDNRPALINLEFNKNTMMGIPPAFKTPADFEDKLGNYRNWFDVIRSGGPMDEPNLCMDFGILLQEGNNYRQAVQQYERRSVLMPQDPDGPLQLTEAFLNILNRPNALFYCYPPSVQIRSAATAAAEHALSRDPKNTNALYLKAWTYIQLGAYLQGNPGAKEPSCPSYSQAYSNSLAASEQYLEIVPNNPGGLLLQSMAEMQLERFDQAISPLTAILTQTNDPIARLNRAISYFRSGNLGAAQTDYESVLAAHPEAYQADYGLAEIAYQNKDFGRAVKYYHLYQSNAPPVLREGAEFKQVDVRLKELKAAPP